MYYRSCMFVGGRERGGARGRGEEEKGGGEGRGEAPPRRRPPDLKPNDLSGWANIAVHLCNVHSPSVTEFPLTR